MIHEMNLHPGPFLSIKNKTKTIEMRLNDEKRSLIKIGDSIVFTNNVSGETLEVEVIDIKKYRDFKELYKDYNKIEIGYDEDEAPKPSDMEMYYSKEKIEKYGTLAIRISVI